jgi:septum formation protein
MNATSRLILASASPRRRELLRRLGLSFTVDVAGTEEDAPSRTQHVERVARRLAREKAQVVAARHPAALILAADTIVVYRGRLFGKPESDDEARAMLQGLRGRWHQVTTGVVLAGGRAMRVRHATTRIRMRHYSDAEIDAYIARGEPFDKAGGYAIQDEQFAPVAEHRGCYCNTVGLPLWTVSELLDQAGIGIAPTLRDMPAECARCPLRG